MATPSFRQLIGVQPSTASPSDSVLLIIDAQNEYATGLLKTVNVASTRKAIKSLLEKYRSSGAEIVHVVHQTPEGAPVFTPGEDVAKEFEELEPKGEEKVIGKQHPSSFAGTDLEEYLQKVGAKKLVLTGYMAHVCVSTTARQASELGYDVVLAEDAIGDRDIPGVSGDEVTKVALLELADAFGTVVKSSDVK
ncbi:phospholipase C type enzyme [Lignoscripta atroalba]|nr:phospholipase C type enzyme [Lignoscripta atroalba]